jgi:hypothetical protein
MLIYELSLHDAVFGVVCGVLGVQLGLLNQSCIHTSFLNIFTICREPVSVLSKTLNPSHNQQCYALLRWCFF